MKHAIQVFETATRETFDARRYLLANIDLRAAFSEDRDKARSHFERFGFKEKRRQITLAFLRSQREKFKRFENTLPNLDATEFPIHVGNSFVEISKYRRESANSGPGVWASELEQNPEKLYADIGAGLRTVVWPNCTYVEVYPSATADLVIEPSNILPFKDASLDGIGCFAVLEHVSKPWQMASEFSRVLKPKGKIFICWPFLQPVHGWPSHYYNATREGLGALFSEDFIVEKLYTGQYEGPDYTINWILNSLLSSIKSEATRLEFSRMTIADLCAEPVQSTLWQKIISEMAEHDVSKLSCGNTLIGMKKSI